MNSLWKQIWRFPGTWAALALIAMLESTFLWWFRPPMIVSALSLLLAAALLIAWVPCYARSDAWLAARQRLRQHLDVATVARIQALEADLERLDAQQALAQLRSLREKLQGLTDVIEKRLDQGELTFGRYLSTAEQVYFSAVDNLQEVAVALTSKASIDSDYIQRRLHEIGDADTGGASEERASLLERRALLLSQNDRIGHLLAQNETAMTALSNTAAALAKVRTERGHASVTAETAMAELEQLASRASSFDVTRP